MQIREAIKILEPLLENQGNFSIRMKLGEEDLGKLGVIGRLATTWTSPGEGTTYMYLSTGEPPFTIRQIYDSLLDGWELHGNCHIVGRVKDKDFEIANFTNGLSDVGGGAKYFGGCSIFLLTSE